MSRVANAPISLPQGVELDLQGRRVAIKGPKGVLEHELHRSVEITLEDGIVRVKGAAAANGAPETIALCGTTRAVLNNMVKGVSQGFERKLELVGVGYRAQMQGRALNLSLGFSHPVSFQPPEGVDIETPSQTEVVVKGVDKQKVGQTAAEIRRFRPPEPYKGKGVKYAGEQIVRKEAKKK